ncbi:MAG: ATP-grasp domain-containing protein [Lachnospiraceae bacterium]|nr:ATP-grasp domain-containing protein [Lachnospiraceae bacterium]
MLSFTEREFIPVLLGGDINTYSVARAFYEQYGVKTYTFGKYPGGPSFNSRIINYTANPKIDTDEVFLQTVNGFAKEHADKKIVLVGCGDSYVALISKHKAELAENIVAPYIDYELMNSLQMKETFYKLCDKHGIDYPGTVIYDASMGLDFPMEFDYPCILKPSNGIRYWECPFPTQNKVYTIHDRAELERVIKDIYGAGYDDKLIIQDRIPGNDEFMRVLTAYSDRNGKVKMMCLGHVLLEEHTPHGLGNHAVIITEPNEELMLRVKNLLEDLHYVGYSNFDIKYDSRDGKFKFFEINTRQGRSNFYVTGSGFNVAKYIVEEYIYGRESELELARDEHLWLVVPKAVALHYVKQPENKAKLKRLLREGKWVNPVFLKGDLAPKRRYAMTRTYLSHFVKYPKYYH